MSEKMTQLLEKLAAVTAERDHWKANHDNRVRAAKLLTERTDMPMERIGAYKHYVAALEANQKLQDALIVAETKLAKLLEQEPVTFVFDPNGYAIDGKHTEISDALPLGMDLYAAPVSVPAVPPPTPFIPDADTRRNDEAFAGYCANRAVLNGSPGGLIESGGCAPAVIAAPSPPEVAAKFWIASGECGKCGQPFSVPGPMVEAAPSVPEEWRGAAQRLIDAAGDKTCSSLRCNYPMDCCSHELIGAMDAMSALLQSADHSGEVKK